MEGDNAADVALDVLQIAGFGVGGLIIGIILSIAMSVVAAAMRRHDSIWRPLAVRMRLAQRIFFMILGTGFGLLFATQTNVAGQEVEWRPILVQVFIIVLILAGANLLTSFTYAVEDMVLHKFKEAEETGHARRVRTQMQMIRRILVALIWVSVVVGIMMTFPAFRGIGATFFASAGLASIVAGLAAQSTLGNIFAGIQIAFTDSVRVGDVVVVEGHQGNIEELTLTYVVVRIWDNRRLVLPSTYFTTTPFENWTKRESRLLGTVVIDVDWFAPIPALRVELKRIVEESDLWDGGSCSLQVIDAVDGRVQVRATVSAATSGNLWDLRCLVREQLVEWMQSTAPYSVPRTRIEPNTTTAPSLEEREEFIDDVEAEWEASLPEPEPAPEPAPPTEDEDDDSIFGWIWGRDDARRARREAERADRKAAKRDPVRLGGHERVLPTPSAEETRVFDVEDLHELELRGFDATRAGQTAAGDEPQGQPRTDESTDEATRTAAEVGPAADGASQTATEPERTSIIGAARARQVDDGKPHSAEARLYSGSPDAEERAKLLAGPGADEMAERENLAKRRLDEYQSKDPRLNPGEGEGGD